MVTTGAGVTIGVAAALGSLNDRTDHWSVYHSSNKPVCEQVIQSNTFSQAEIDSLEIPAGSAVQTGSGYVLGVVKSDEPEFVHGEQSLGKDKTSKRRKKDNSHLNKKFEVGQDNLELERSVVEKKTPSHGTDFGLEPELDSEGNPIVDRKTGKTLAKQNKENYEEKRFVCFNRYTGKFVSGWVMNQDQFTEFLENNNFI